MTKRWICLAAGIFMGGLGGEVKSSGAPSGYLLNLYHFNIQYVVGHEPSMRRIVEESFEPLVDFYLAHPEWGADFEMQGLMIDYLGRNYPEVLEKFRRLVNSGQAELVTFHYADQLLLAFPRHDQEWSLRLNDQLLAKYGIRRCGVIFTQEAQFGEGFAEIGKEHGYEVGVMTESQYVWFQDDERFPYFTANGMEVLVKRDAVEPGSGIKVKWLFLGDGELVVTGGFSPYFPGLFRTNQARIAFLEKQMKAAEAEGFKPSKISAYVAALRSAGVKPAELRPFLDAPWRPEDGSGVFQWMGKYVSSWERDYDLRTKNWQVRNVLVEAERAGAEETVLAEAWAHLLNAEVSDPTGWYPLPVEVRFAYEEMDAALAALAQDKNLDLAALRKKAKPVVEVEKAAAVPPVAVRRFGAAQKASLSWTQPSSIPAAYCLTVSWSGKGDGGIAFPLESEAVEYSPAMLEEMVRVIPISAIKGKPIHLALTNGLIGLGNRTYLVRENAYGTVAAGLYFQDREVRFEVQQGREPEYRFRFYLFRGAAADEVLGFANSLNQVRP